METPSDAPESAPLAVRDAEGVLRLWLLWWWPWPLASERVPAPERLSLRDGTTAWVRPLTKADRDLHVEAYRRLSTDTKYRRFLTPMPELTEELLDRLVDGVDGVDHIAYYVFVDGQESALPVAIGRIVRDPERENTADIAVTVQDEWQGRGIGTALVRLLVERRPRGVTDLLTVIAEDNPASLAMLGGLGPSTVTPIGDGVNEIRVNLVGADAPEPGPGREEPIGWSPWRLHLHQRDRLCPWLP